MKKKEYHCKDCGRTIFFCDTLASTYNGRCVDCHIKHKEKKHKKIKRPEHEKKKSI